MLSHFVVVDRSGWWRENRLTFHTHDMGEWLWERQKWQHSCVFIFALYQVTAECEIDGSINKVKFLFFHAMTGVCTNRVLLCSNTREKLRFSLIVNTEKKSQELVTPTIWWRLEERWLILCFDTPFGLLKNLCIHKVVSKENLRANLTRIINARDWNKMNACECDRDRNRSSS
jgi:hypothetical protein